MTTAIAAFLKVYQGSNTFGRWQNFFIDQEVNGFAFKAFNTSDILMNRSADEGGLGLELAATNRNLQFFETAISNEYLAQLTLYEMQVTSALPKNINGATVVARFTGEVLGMSTDLETIEVEVGAAIDAISGDIPGRKITTSLVGRLPTL